jgi:regulator of sirC expression with transglutaminase-like and TPR domain
MTMQWQEAADALNGVVTEEPDRLDLVVAYIATLDPSAWPVEKVVARLDELAADAPGPAAPELVAHVFDTLGFVGNAGRYYDPSNSLIHRVLHRRRGLPLTLAVVAVEISRRAGGRLTVVGFPGHVLVGDELTPDQWFDPFGAGAPMSRIQLQMLLQQFQPGATLRPEMTLPMSAADVTVRTLNNLVNAYQRLGMLSRMVDVLRFRCRLDMAAEGDRLQLAGALAASGRYDQAADEFELLVDLDPDNAAGHASVAERLRAHRN